MGSGAGNAAARTITILLDPLPGISPSAVSVFNEYAASGGTDGETLDDLLARGLAFLQEPFRAVSEQDFAFLIQQAVPGKVSRIKVVADQNLEALPPEAEAHISVIVLPSRGELALTEQPATYNAATEIFTLNRTAAVLTASLAGTQVKRLYREIFRYLDQRRLITTIVHVVRPVFTIVRLRIDLQAKPGVNLEVLKKNVGEAMATFLDPYAGWQEGDGWPYGRDVYRSELYQLLESLEGVDHVTALSMNNDPVTALISVGENHLVALDGLSVTVSS
jgi:predicted phage baseplate assembly protein